MRMLCSVVWFRHCVLGVLLLLLAARSVSLGSLYNWCGSYSVVRVQLRINDSLSGHAILATLQYRLKTVEGSAFR
jgi:hypothetical protein